MYTRISLRGAASAFGLSLLLTFAGASMTGCGGREEPAPEPETAVEETVATVQETAEEAVETVTEAAAEAAAALLPGDVPATAAVLQLMPAEASAAIALPAPNVLVNEIIPVLERVFPDADIQREVDDMIADLAREANVDDAATLAEIAAARGLDFDQPIALFIDLAAALGDPAAASSEEDADGAPAYDEEALFEEDWDDAEGFALEEMPDVALVLHVSDAAAAEAFVKELAKNLGGLDAPESTETGGVTIQQFGDDLAYYVSGGKIALSNSATLLRGVAAREAAPAAIRYGTPDAPAEHANEIVALLQGSRVMPLLTGFAEASGALDAGTAALLGQQLGDTLSAWVSEDDDPIIVTLAVDDTRVQLNARVDTTTHPNVLTASGEAAPLRLSTSMPEGTLGFLNLRLTPEFKDRLKNVMDNLPDDVAANAQTAQGIAMGGQFLGMLGDEIALGLTPVPEDFPAILLMIGLEQVDVTRGLIAMFAQPQKLETHREVEISTITLAPIPLYLAYPAGTAVASNSLEMLKDVMDNLLEGTPTGLYGGLNPPMDPKLPRYNALYIDSALLTDVILPLSMLVGGLPGDAGPVLDEVTKVVKSLRSTQEIQGDWLVARLALALQPAG